MAEKTLTVEELIVKNQQVLESYREEIKVSLARLTDLMGTADQLVQQLITLYTLKG